jgi:large subunit ribosomal protein L22
MVLSKTEVVARNSSISVGVRKMSEVVRLIIGLPIGRAIDILQLSHKGCSKDILVLLYSAAKNAVNQLEVDDLSNLYIKDVRLGRGRKMKRFMARARGRGNRITKHFSNLCIVVGSR